MLDNAIAIAKRLKELSDDIQSLELKEQIVALRGELVSAREEMLDLRRANATLREEVEVSERRRSAPRPEVRHRGHYVYYLPNGGTGWKGPCCPNCHAESEKLLMLEDHVWNPQHNLGKYYCPTCKTRYEQDPPEETPPQE